LFLQEQLQKSKKIIPFCFFPVAKYMNGCPYTLRKEIFVSNGIFSNPINGYCSPWSKPEASFLEGVMGTGFMVRKAA